MKKVITGMENEFATQNVTVMEGANNEPANVLRTIRTQDQFRSILDGIMGKQQINIPSLTINLKNGKYETAVEVSTTALSRGYKDDEVLSYVGVRHLKGIKHINNKFTFGYLMVSLTNKSAERAKNIFGGEIYLVHSSNGWIKVYATLRTTDRLTDLETGVDYDYSVLKAGKSYRYKGLAWTASNRRNLSLIFRCINNGDDRYDILQEATCNGVEPLVNEFGGRTDSKTVETLQKKGGYIGNVMTPSINFGSVPGYVVLEEKWLNNTNETFLIDEYSLARKEHKKAIMSGDKVAIESSKKALDAIINKRTKLKFIATQDGQVYINARVITNMIREQFGYIVSPAAITGLMIQLRPGTMKASGVIVSEEVFNALVDGTVTLANKLGAKVNYYGDRSNLLYIADRNAIKLDYDVTKEITLEILAFAKCSEGKTSKQLAETVLYAANELGVDGQQLLYDLLHLSVDEKVASLTTDKKARLLTPEEIDNALESGYINDVVLAIAPRIMDQNRAIFNSVWRQAINSVTNMIDKLNASIVSHNRRLASDPVFIITGGALTDLLKTGEVFINSKKITKVAMFKYPKMGLREFYYAENVTLDTIKYRLRGFLKMGKITKEQSDAILKFYSELDSFTAVLPAKAVIAYACAGLDFDFDGALFVEYTKNATTEIALLTNQLVDLLANTKMKAVRIDSDEKAI